MPTLAPPLPAPPPAVRPHRNGAVALGTALNFWHDAITFHGRDLRTLLENMLNLERRNAELTERLISASAEPDDAEEFEYAPMPPLRSFYIEAVFERGHEIQPIPYELHED
jgi:hypothetical protein